MGVDIFFVISGYLISGIILPLVLGNAFSYSTFYTRRIRRIFPSLLLVLSTCLALGWFLLLADEYRQLGFHTAGGAGFMANFIFQGEQGYFNNAAETKPLLHLWSLSIEEQFYLLWPLLLVFLFRSSLSPGLTIAAIIAASFALNLLIVGDNPNLAFYAPQTRLWELATGGLIALAQIREAERTKEGCSVRFLAGYSHLFPPWKSLAGLAGLILVTWSASTYDRAMPFPSWRAAMPVLGAALIIVAGLGSWPNRQILGHPLLVWLGLVSYPFYLWHWPLLSFAHIVTGGVPAPELRLQAVALALILAWASYHFVERPIRFGAERNRFPYGLVALTAVIAGCGMLITMTNGVSSRSAAKLEVVNPGDIGHESFFAYIRDHHFPCKPPGSTGEAIVSDPAIRCAQSKADVPIQLAIVGDSHAEHLFIGLADGLPAINVAYFVTGAPPFVSNTHFRRIAAHLAQHQDIRTVLYTAHWSRRAEECQRGRSFDQELHNTIEALTAENRKVFVLDDTPAFSTDPRRCKFGRPLAGKVVCDQPRATALLGQQQLEPRIAAVTNRHPRTTLARISDTFCGRDSCSQAFDGLLMYRDTNHLNINGSRHIGQKLLREHPDIGGTPSSGEPLHPDPGLRQNPPITPSR